MNVVYNGLTLARQRRSSSGEREKIDGETERRPPLFARSSFSARYCCFLSPEETEIRIIIWVITST